MGLNIVSLLTILFSVSRVWSVRPNIFNPVSNATCQPEYAWMENAEQQSPCLTVAYVIAACVGDTWTQPALPPGYTYDPPNGTTVTPCYCSWSCYNLMMACTLCQSAAYTNAITTWPSFSQNCPSNYKVEIFPQGYVLANIASIPYWATINPSTWPNELFDINEAQNYTAQHHPDYQPSNTNPSPGLSPSSSGGNINVGAIVGGTVGGVAGLLFILLGGYFLYKSKKHGRSHGTDGTATQVSPMGLHMTTLQAHWPSDPSTTVSPTPTGSPPPMSYMNTQTQGTGMVLSPTSYSTLPMVSSPAADTASFVTAGNMTAPRTAAIPIV